MTSDMSIQKQTRLRDVFFKYLIGLFIFVLSCLFVGFIYRDGGFIPFVLYFAVGVYLTKVYLPQLIEFHPVWNTIDNLVGVKIRAILLWPLFYLILLMKLGFLHVMR